MTGGKRNSAAKSEIWEIAKKRALFSTADRVHFRLGAWQRCRGFQPSADTQSALKRTANPAIAPCGNRASAGFPCQTPVETGGRAICPQRKMDLKSITPV